MVTYSCQSQHAKCTWSSFLFFCTFLLHWWQCLMISVHCTHPQNVREFTKTTKLYFEKLSCSPLPKGAIFSAESHFEAGIAQNRLNSQHNVYQVLTKQNVPMGPVFLLSSVTLWILYGAPAVSFLYLFSPIFSNNLKHEFVHISKYQLTRNFQSNPQ